MQKKAILTNVKLSPGDEDLLRSSIGKSYDLISDETKGRLEDVEIILLGWPRSFLSQENISRMPSLRLIQTISAGVDHIDFSIIPRDVIVCGNVGAYALQMAEHVFAMILFFAKNLGVHNSELAKGIFQREPLSMFLRGKTIGILGTGGIGTEVARLAKNGFGMRTIGLNRTGKISEHFDSALPLEQINKMLPLCEIVVLCLPITNKTRNLIDSQKLELMRKDAILVNVARGGIIVEEDLYMHLKDNPNFRCGLDVWWKYPERGKRFDPSHPFFELANFIGSPHNSGDVPEEGQIAMRMAIENILRYVNGESVKGAANAEEYL